MKEKTLGYTIAELRKAQGMTQADLAEKMNVTDKAVSKWERDLSCPDVGLLPRLAEVLGVSLDELMRIQPKEKKAGGSVEDLIVLVCKAVSLAMGVSVVVLSALGKMETNAAVSLLGIGLTCVGIVLLKEPK